MSARLAQRFVARRSVAFARYVLLLSVWSAACGDTDPGRRARRAERDQL